MMYNEMKALFLKVLTPLHAGSGTDLRAVDLPIQREIHTGFPKIEASTLKGCLRNAFKKLEKSKIDMIFGKEGEGELSAAALAITDARLLFFPVRSAKGVYALITCPMVLERFRKDMELAGISEKEGFTAKLSDVAPIAVCNKDNVLVIQLNKEKQAVLLDEYRYDLSYNAYNDSFNKLCTKLQAMLPSPNTIADRAIILPDNDFKDFVTHATSVVTRIRVGENGVVENQGLFTEEYLPEESILYSLAMMGNSKLKSNPADAKELMSLFSKDFPKIFQIGADETLGKGFVETHLQGGGGDE